MKRNILSPIGILSITILLSFLTAAMVPIPALNFNAASDSPVSPFPGLITSFGHSPSTLESSIAKSLLLLQKSGYIFTAHSREKCASCHHNTLTSMAVDLGRRKGFPAIDSFTTGRVAAMERSLKFACNPNLVTQFLPANFVEPYILLGLNADRYPPGLYTDLSVDYLISQAKPDGSFLAESGRVPLETGDIHLTAMAIRAIQLYGSPSKKEHIDTLVKKTRQWLETTRTGQQQELVFQLLGMHWCGSATEPRTRVANQLLALQNPDGGWSQLPTLQSDAYATGQALYALYESSILKTEDSLYQKGLNYLLRTQEKNGAWFVETRSYPIQPFVDSDFPPYDENQFISAAASNWAVMALLEALPDITLSSSSGKP